jgi:hypothetical protein
MERKAAEIRTLGTNGNENRKKRQNGQKADRHIVVGLQLSCNYLFVFLYKMGIILDGNFG